MTKEEMFQACISSILEHEGGLTMDKRDPGGTTNWGVSLRYLKAMGLDLNGDGQINDEDVIGLHKDGAITVYRKYWWYKYKYEMFYELIIVEKVFDMAVNMGAITAHKLLQIALNRLRWKPITVDGLLGTQTFLAANATNSTKLRDELRICAKHHYDEILANHPNMEWARNGWMNRAEW